MHDQSVKLRRLSPASDRPRVYLSVVSALQDSSVIVQFVCYS